MMISTWKNQEAVSEQMTIVISCFVYAWLLQFF